MDKSNVSAGKPRVGGAVFRAPVGTTAPTDATTALAEAFVSQGYCSDEGVTNNVSRTSEDIRAWGGDNVMTTQTEQADEFTFTLIESLNPEVLKTVHGDSNVTGALATGLTVGVTGEELPESVWVVDMIMRGGVLKRIVIPSAKITNVNEVTYDDSSAVGYAITLSASPDSNGKYHYEYFKTPSTGASSGATPAQQQPATGTDDNADPETDGTEG